MCRGLRVETAIDGSFCRCKKGSPVGHVVPETMLTFVPATCAFAPGDSTSAPKNARTSMEHRVRAVIFTVELLKGVESLNTAGG
jgi:hypothetical protein